MTKKQEALDKAKESGKKIIEGGKKFGVGATEVIGGTTGALGYALVSGYEAGASGFSKLEEKEKGISDAEKMRRKDKTKGHYKKAKEHVSSVGHYGKKILPGAKKVIGGGLKVAGHTLKAGYHLIDAGDKALGEYIEKKQLEKGKHPGKAKQIVRDNIIKILMALGLAGYGGYKTVESVDDKERDKIETIIKVDNKENSNGYEVNFNEKEYFRNPDFFNKEFKITIDETYRDKGVVLIRDAGMTFYIVQDGEKKKEKIIEKLSSIPEFSYLKDPVYANKIKGFNIPDSSLKEGLYIPIPVKIEDRSLNIEEFREYSKIALHEMENDSIYGEKTKKIVEEIGEKKIINAMIAYARCETSMDQKTFSDPIGAGELHRWEPRYKSFSFSFFHVLMEKNADGKTSGPGLKARQNLGLTEGQCYHPINACKLFLGYCFEKVKSDPAYFFKINSLEEAKTKGGKYNGSSSYGVKLWDNIQYLSKK